MRLAVVIPAYNEEQRLPSVLGAVLQSPLASEIIVVDDGSTDGTFRVAETTPGVQAIRLERNRGKGAAMVAGALAAGSQNLLFLDADLIGLTPGHVEDLARPVLSQQADMTVGVFKGGRFFTDLAQRIAPSISGQRCLKRSSFLEARRLADLRYGVEVALYRHALESGYRIVSVPLAHLTHPTKEEKVGWVRGGYQRLKMYAEIGRGLSIPLRRVGRRLTRDF